VKVATTSKALTAALDDRPLTPDDAGPQPDSAEVNPPEIKKTAVSRRHLSAAAAMPVLLPAGPFDGRGRHEMAYPG
jgi:hypothetical protein